MYTRGFQILQIKSRRARVEYRHVMLHAWNSRAIHVAKLVRNELGRIRVIRLVAHHKFLGET